MKKLLSEVLLDIRPDERYEKEILSKSDNVIRSINKELKNAKAVLGGSGAKGTWLKTFDADIFVKFNYAKFKDKSSQLSDILEKFLKKRYRVKRLHGSRDYFQIKQGKFTFEVIPILEIKKAEQAKNITDVSPLHSDFVLKHKNLVDEMRLTKQFFKAAKVYGAESHIKGFSGYVCEISTVYYGSFLKLIRAIPKWKEKKVIDVKNYYRKKNVFTEINKSKLTSPLIVVDPVQKDRNAAAALDHEKFEVIKHRAKEFLKKPTKDFFEVKALTGQDIRKKFPRNAIIFLKANPLRKKEDIAGAKMLKAFHFIEKNLLNNGFKIIEGNMVWHNSSPFFYYVLEKDRLSETMELMGPPLKAKRHVEIFKNKYKKTFIKKRRVLAIKRRDFVSAKDLIAFLLKKPNVKDNVSNIKLE